MNQIVLTKIEEMTYEKNGQKFIRLGSYCLDFKQEYVFLGITKNGNKVILGDIYQQGPNVLKFDRRFGKIEKRESNRVNPKMTEEGQDHTEYFFVYRIVTDGHRYSEDIPGTEGLD